MTKLTKAAIPTNLQPGTFSQLVDHFGDASANSPSAATFQQRYWIDSEYATDSNAPILLRLCGEGGADYFLNDTTPLFAKQLGAHILYLEHRYYGQSQPFNNLSAEHMKFLTLENVIEDIATFQKWISQDRKLTGKWITIGGSYSGTLSALYRELHPELVVGALAASAPMISKPSHETNSGMDELSSIDIQDYAEDGGRQWAYQACATFGFWEMMSGPYFLEPNAQLCDQLFGIKVRANKDAYNAKYYTPFVTNSATSVTHVLFTNGTEDGWAKISIDAANNKNPGITLQVIQGAGHHYDLNPDQNSPAVEQARALFVKLAHDWLK